MKNTRNQTCALGSSHATAPRAATSGHYFKMTTGALSPAAKAANSQQQSIIKDDTSIRGVTSRGIIETITMRKALVNGKFIRDYGPTLIATKSEIVENIAEQCHKPHF